MVNFKVWNGLEFSNCPAWFIKYHLSISYEVQRQKLNFGSELLVVRLHTLPGVADRFIKDVKEITAAIIKVCHDAIPGSGLPCKIFKYKNQHDEFLKSSCIASVSPVSFIQKIFAWDYIDVVIWISHSSFWHTKLVYIQC